MQDQLIANSTLQSNKRQLHQIFLKQTQKSQLLKKTDFLKLAQKVKIVPELIQNEDVKELLRQRYSGQSINFDEFLSILVSISEKAFKNTQQDRIRMLLIHIRSACLSHFKTIFDFQLSISPEASTDFNSFLQNSLVLCQDQNDNTFSKQLYGGNFRSNSKAKKSPANKLDKQRKMHIQIPSTSTASSPRDLNLNKSTPKHLYNHKKLAKQSLKFDQQSSKKVPGVDLKDKFLFLHNETQKHVRSFTLTPSFICKSAINSPKANENKNITSKGIKTNILKPELTTPVILFPEKTVQSQSTKKSQIASKKSPRNKQNLLIPKAPY